MTKDGFREAKSKAIAALVNGTYQNITNRSAIDTKNLLFTGLVTAQQICDIIKRSRGTDHSTSSHHQEASILVHVIQREGWYLKFYFLDPDTFFISVHQ